MLALADILARFAPATRVGPGKYRTVCPVHGGGSLVITQGDTSVLFKCWAMDCPLEALLAAAGLAMADISPTRSAASLPTGYVAIHDYRDAMGTLRYQVLQERTPPSAKKKFKQRRPSANGSEAWIWNLDGIERLPFRLPDLVGHSLVWIVEGEKDVNRLWQLGLPATCNSGGTGGGWPLTLSRALLAIGVQRAIILQDADRPGATHAALVAQALERAGIHTRLLPPFPGVPLPGGDISDWLDAGHTRDELEALAQQAPVSLLPVGSLTRRLTLTPARAITIRPVQWLWEDRMALGTFCLIGGREGVGKSLLAYTLAAQLTQGLLPGQYFHTPRSVVVAAAEDSWEHTIVPRLMAAGADLAQVFRIDVITPTGDSSMLSLPTDIGELHRVVTESSAALILLDPLLSRVAADLDTHKDSEVRLALEPLATVADRTGATVLGLIHVNKSQSTDALTMLMGSRAFVAVARSVLFVLTDPEDATKRLMGQAKNNLGRMDLASLAFHITGVKVADAPEGEIWTAHLQWLGNAASSLHDAILASALRPQDQPAVDEAALWLTDYLTATGGPADSAKIKRAGQRAGHTIMTLQRARAKIHAVVSSVGFPRQTFWALETTAPVVSTLHETTGDSEVF